MKKETNTKNIKDKSKPKQKVKIKKAEKNINLNFLIIPKSIYLSINFLFFLYLNYLNKNPYQELLRKVVLKVYDLTNL